MNTGSRLLFVVMLALGTACWTGAALSWTGWSDFLFVGLGDHRAATTDPFDCTLCFEEGAPRPVPDWVKVPWALCPLLALGSGLLVGRLVPAARSSIPVAAKNGSNFEAVRIEARTKLVLPTRKPGTSFGPGILGRVRAGLILGSIACGAVSLLAIGATIAVERHRWVEGRFVRGDLYTPLFSLWFQWSHTRCAAAAAIVVAASFAFLAAVHRFRGRAVVLLAALAHGVVAGIAFGRLDEDSGAVPLDVLLPQWASVSLRCSLLAALAVALGGGLWVVATREPPSRATWGVTLTWLLLGVSLRFITAPYDVNLAHPPSLAHRPATIPPSSGPHLPIVERCEALRTYSEVLELTIGGVRSSVPDPAQPTHGPPVVAITSEDRDARTEGLQPFLERALHRGVREADVAVLHLVPHETATYGAVHDQRVCVLPAPLADLLGTHRYDNLVDRAQQ